MDPHKTLTRRVVGILVHHVAGLLARKPRSHRRESVGLAFQLAIGAAEPCDMVVDVVDRQPDLQPDHRTRLSRW